MSKLFAKALGHCYCFQKYAVRPPGLVQVRGGPADGCAGPGFPLMEMTHSRGPRPSLLLGHLNSQGRSF